MKRITLFLAMISICGTTHAGLFEYYMGGEAQPNTTTTTDSLETIEQYEAPKTIYKPSYSSSYNGNNYSYYSGYSRPGNYYTNHTSPKKPYYDSFANESGFYRYDVLKRTLEDNIKRLEREADRIDDMKRDIKKEINRLKKYSGAYYRDLRRELELRYDDLKDREKQVEDMIDDEQDELKKLKRNKNKKSNSYYYYDGYYQIYDDYYFDRDTYSYYRSDYYYDYEENEYRPSWVNPKLENRRDGYIYIR